MSSKSKLPTLPVSGAQPFLLQGSERFGMTGILSAVYYPADHATLVGECHCASAIHIELIERAAEKGFEQFRRTKPSQRASILWRLGDLIERHQEKLSVLMTQESGKPIKLSHQEVARAIQVCRGYAVEADRSASQHYHTEGRQGRVNRFPLGPVLAITPYNFPLNLIVHKLAPAIASGCSFTVKPSPKTPLTALYLGKLSVEAGYEAISVIPTENVVAEALVQSSSFAKLSFTGSATVGWRLKSLAGQKSVTLELGGNAALIIEELKQDIDAMAERVAFGAFAYSGQICISLQRLFVHERLRETFMPALVRATRALQVGDPMKPETDLGPMITIDAVQQTRRLIKQALQEGANVVYGGNTYNALTMNPTLIDRTTPEMAVNAEEAFGPILTLSSYSDFETALHEVNRSKFGLQAGLYTQNITQIEQAYQTLDVGGLIINDIPTFRSDLLPYGGTKGSGMGREGILAGIDDYSYLKALIINPI